VNSITFALGDTQFICVGDPTCAVGVSEAICPNGMVATGGGYEYEEGAPTDNSVPINSSNLDGNGWIVGMVNHASIDADFYAVAHCVPGRVHGAASASRTAVSKAQAVRTLRAQVKSAR
jgi:hypothetical protein